MNTRTKLGMAGLLVVLAAGPAYSQNRDILQLQRDMIEVQQRVTQLQTTVDRDNAVMKGLLEKTADQVNMLAEGMQKITQVIDGMKEQNEASARELRSTVTTLNGAVKELEDNLSAARSQINSIAGQVTNLKTTAEPLSTPDDLWKSAYLDYTVGNWDLAIGGFQEFLSKFPADARAVEAQLGIGDALYAQKKYDLAITQYDIVLQKYPNSDKTSAALLKKGLAQAETNPQEAAKTLNDVVKTYPGSSEANAANAKLRELRSAPRPKTPAR